MKKLCRLGALVLALGLLGMLVEPGGPQVTEASAGEGMLEPFWGSAVVTQEFGDNSSGYGPHKGIDVVPVLDWVRAPADGIVRATGYDWRGGKYIVIQHRSGDANQYRGYCAVDTWTKYLHLARYYVRPDQWVTKGQVIGRVGSTGAWCTGPHLHFEIRENGRYGRAVDPREYIRFGDGRDLW